MLYLRVENLNLLQLEKIPQMGPRPDHIDDPTYDRAAVDLPGLKLLGDRQLKFLDQWSRDWTDAEIKVALSATAFCGAVHVHGNKKPKRLLADLDCNGWPQTGRNSAILKHCEELEHFIYVETSILEFPYSMVLRVLGMVHLHLQCQQLLTQFMEDGGIL